MASKTFCDRCNKQCEVPYRMEISYKEAYPRAAPPPASAGFKDLCESCAKELCKIPPLAMGRS